MTTFWQPPRKEQIITELRNDVTLIKDSLTGKPVGMEILSYHTEDDRIDSVTVEM